MEDEELKKLHEEMQMAFKALQARIMRSEEEIKKFGTPLGDTKAAIEKIQDHLDKLEKKYQERLDQLETKLARPPLEGDKSSKFSEVEQKQIEAFEFYIRKGEKGMSPEHSKALATDQNTQGGYLLPRNVRDRIIELLTELSPVRALAFVETISSGDALEIPTEGSTAFATGWVSERGTRTETAAGTFGMEKIPVHEIYASPRITQKQLDDAAFNMEEWIRTKVARRIAIAEATAFVSGDGVGKPEGILTKSGITEVNSGAAAALTADGLINLFYQLPEFYANNATWIMRRATVRDIRKLKDAQNQYLWQPGLAGTTPATILDRPYREAPDMPAVAANAYPVLLGDFRAGYIIVDRQGINVLRDPYSAKPFVEFYTTMRVGGQVVLAEAFVKQKVAA